MRRRASVAGVTTDPGRTAAGAAGAAGLIPARAWHRMRTGSGTKGTRHYDWAMLEVASDDTPGGHAGGHSFLLARRHRYTGTLSYYRCWTPGPVPLFKLIAIATARWKIEEDHQLSKQAVGLDAGLIPVTIPELQRLLRGIVIPPPRRDRPHRLYWPDWRRRHQHRARQAHQRWNAYAETTP